MKKIIFPFFILIIFSISFFSASTLGISPGTIKISEKTNEIACRNFTLMGEENYIFNGEIKWSGKNSRNLIDYTISSDKLKIDSQIPFGIKSGTYQICFSSKTAGNYYGALKYKMNNSSYGIGTWVELNVSGENNVQNILSLTGEAINNFDYGKIFLFIPILLLITLFFLLRKLKNKTEFN